MAGEIPLDEHAKETPQTNPRGALTYTTDGLSSNGTTGSGGDATIVGTLSAQDARSQQIAGAHARRILEPTDRVEGEPYKTQRVPNLIHLISWR